ncbi:protein yellow [Anopheles ziemanni]|uniref:protein yellow n=1 Tax=Anopheles coustani TaxID=139045 RepID=UPI002657D11A|nr:protein yellow [Anopheles coustani]XP_058167021.1 protein yellow [Anopheles ziemanni]
MKYFIQSLICILLAVPFQTVVEAVKLKEKFKWREVSYAWPSEETKQEALRSGNYIVHNNLPLGLERWRDKLFITVPRWKSGVAASLTYVNVSDEISPDLRPYPSWEENQLPTDHHTMSDEDSKYLKNNASIISTFRVRADECDRLWVMDTGLADILGDAVQYAPPSLVLFDLYTDKLIRRHYFNSTLLKEDSFFANVIVDTERGDCDNAFAYIPDLGSYAVIVYSFAEDRSWRIKHNFFHFDPLAGDYNIGGVNFQWTDGVFGMAVGKRLNDGTRPVYFHAFSSTKEFMVSNAVLKNESYAQSPQAYYDYKLLGDRGPNSQSSAEFYDPETGVIFYTQVNKDGVGCWNTGMTLNTDTQGLVDSDSDALVFPNDLKVDTEGMLWVLSDRLPMFIFTSLDEGQYNYRILVGETREMIKGTPCDS